MKLIAGLGNPGERYACTYHNVGFRAAELTAEKLGAKFSLKPRLMGAVAEGRLGAEKVIVVKPQTYMNDSGECISLALSYYKISLDDLLIIYDDVDIDAGKIRFRPSGSAGTHNGMRSILAHLNSQAFPRLKIGTKPDDDKIPLIDYVLMNVPRERLEIIDPAIKRAAELALDFARGVSNDALMCRYNG